MQGLKGRGQTEVGEQVICATDEGSAVMRTAKVETMRRRFPHPSPTRSIFTVEPATTRRMASPVPCRMQLHVSAFP
jgi:hypothetical protein